MYTHEARKILVERDRDLIACAIFELWAPSMAPLVPTTEQINKVINQFHRDEEEETLNGVTLLAKIHGSKRGKRMLKS